MKLNKQNKAFTLVELMIVIAIIGVLAATLLPRLQGAQERSRDTGRLSSIKQISAVLQTYFSDTSRYPQAPSTTGGDIDTDSADGCLSATDGTVHEDLEGLFTGNKAPIDPSRSNISYPCPSTVPGSYGYYAITKNGIPKGGYVLATNVESDQKANYDASNTFDGSATYDAIQSNIQDLGESGATGLDSIYVEQS